MQDISWPNKTREIHTNHFDSSVWNDYNFRDDDIIIASYAKSGTTWTQQIVAQLLFQGAENLPVADMSPWIDLRIPPAHIKLGGIEAQEHRRFVKTHLPVDALVFSPKAKYIYIARDGRDVVWSLFNHHSRANEKWYDALNNSPGLVGEPMPKPVDSVVDYYNTWLEKDGYPFWSQWENVRSWWANRELPNVMLIHFSNLKADLPGSMRSIAEFLEIDYDAAKWDDMVYHCTFDYMKSNSELTAPLNGMFWDDGATAFIHKGVNGRWREMLSEEQADAYVRKAQEELGEACAHWLVNGEMP